MSLRGQYVLNIYPELKHPNNGGIEKHILRKAFCDFLPLSIVHRQKDAFSDAVGYSWKDCLKKHSKNKINRELSKLEFGVPTISSEEEYYKQVYYEYFKNWNQIDYMWRPKWTDVLDPSATFLSNHRNIEAST